VRLDTTDRAYRIEPLSARHDRAAFSCGVSPLDSYIQRQARQDLDRNLAAVFILTPNGEDVSGFYTLSAQSISADDLPGDQARRLPSLPLPVTLLGRMAISQALHGRGLGEFLLMNSLERCLYGSKQVASWAVIVDAKIGARGFYLKHQFAPLPSQPDRLFLPMKSIATLFAS